MENYLINMNDKVVTLENVNIHPGPITENTLVIDMFTDFRNKKPIFIQPNTLADDAYEMMKIRHIRSLFILDNNANIMGLITSRILSDTSILEFMARRNIRSRKDVQVVDLMIDKKDIHAISYDILKNKKITIKTIIEMFCQLHERHIFVAQTTNAKEVKIIGIISAADIARGMHINLDPNLETLTFSSLAHH